ncbi:MAG: DUF1572 domain-containing protein [Ignavibacteria bacterium]|nr:DUF1572 domain-containing protein [Ignavibacteria bacterium]
MNPGSAYLSDVLDQLAKLRRMGDTALSQVSEEQFFWKPDAESNSIALIMKHMAGNMRSRWTDFLTSDGEKGDRRRDSEFEAETTDSREAITKKWEEGWDLTITTIGGLAETDLPKTIQIRNETHTVMQAINRQLVHYATHVGQIVYLAKHLAGEKWKTLSIPRGESDTFEVSRMGEPYRKKR